MNQTKINRGLLVNQTSNQAENFDKKILLRPVKDLDAVKEVDGSLLAYNYVGKPGDDARAVLVKCAKECPNTVFVEVARVISTGDWVEEYYIIINEEDGAVIYKTEKAHFLAFDYEYTPWDNDLHLELRFWFDYQEVVVLEVNLGSQPSKLNKEE